jgi:hypothetical protein
LMHALITSFCHLLVHAQCHSQDSHDPRGMSVLSVLASSYSCLCLPSSTTSRREYPLHMHA